MITINPKRTAERIPLVFDFLSRLVVGDSLTSATCTVTVFSGVDPTPSNVLVGSAAVSGTKVSQPIGGGVNGTIYKIVCTGSTSNGFTPSITAYLPVIDDPL